MRVSMSVQSACQYSQQHVVTLPLLPRPLPRLSILQDTQAKVMARVTQLQQLEPLIQELLQEMPPGTSLQDLARPLGQAGGAAAAAAAPAAAPAAGAAAKPPAALK